MQEILHLHERQMIRLFLRRDAFARFVSCMVYVPRERYNTDSGGGSRTSCRRR